MAERQVQEFIRWCFTLALIETCGALVWLLLIFATQASDLNPALSARHLAFTFPFWFGSILFGWLAWCFRRGSQRGETWSQRILSLAGKDWPYWLAISMAGLACAGGFYAFLIGLRAQDLFSLTFGLRLGPYTLWIFLLAIQTLLAVRLLRYGSSVDVFKAYRTAFYASLTAVLILACLAAWVLYTRIGLTPDVAGWGQPGVPLLPYQVSLALLISLALWSFGILVRHVWHGRIRISNRTLDALICVALWSGAVWVWSAQPLKPAYFAPRPTPPNNEYYPHSDAAIYDLSAQRLLLGSGFEQNVVRPVYSSFLALAQGISGIGYSSVIAWQVPVLASIPALLYLLAKALHHRGTGMLVGLLAVMHESNALALTGVIEDSTSKMMMSDMPTTLGVILLSLIVVLWLKDVNRNRLYPFLAGGVIGVFMLIRTQFILLLPVVLVMAWFPYRKQPTRWLKDALILLAGLVITLAPWVWRNLTQTGQKALADPQAAGIIYRYASLVPDSNIRLPDETEDEYRSRLEQETNRYLFEHPLVLAKVMASHYWNNHLATLLVLPSSFPVLFHLKIIPQDPTHPGLYWLSFKEQCCSLSNYVKSSPFWLKAGDVRLTWNSALPLLLSLILLSVGIGSTWSRTRFAGLLPLSMAVVYSLSSALARLSGWRYNLPVDWVGIVYYSAGLMQVCFWLATFFANRFIPAGWEPGPEVQPQAGRDEAGLPWKGILLAGAGFFLLTAAIPISEHIIPEHYEGMTVESVLATLDAEALLQPAGVHRQDLEGLLKTGDVEAVIGRAMYPRFYKAGKGLPGGHWASYDPKDYSRLGFILSPTNTSIILPARAAPSPFPNASDVLVIGCRQPDHVEALLVAILKEPKAVFMQKPVEEWNCATP